MELPSKIISYSKKSKSNAFQYLENSTQFPCLTVHISPMQRKQK